jgi:hypothetical protein
VFHQVFQNFLYPLGHGLDSICPGLKWDLSLDIMRLCGSNLQYLRERGHPAGSLVNLSSFPGQDLIFHPSIEIVLIDRPDSGIIPEQF